MSSSYSFASRRSILREVNDKGKSGGGDHPDYAVELNATNFDAVLKETPATFAVVEFFAHWLVLMISAKLLYFMCFESSDCLNSLPGVIKFGFLLILLRG